MNKPATSLNMYGAITLNGKILYTSPEPLMMQMLIREMIITLNQIDNHTNAKSFSTCEFKFSKRPIVETKDEFMSGIDMSHVIIEGSEEYRQLFGEQLVDDLMIQSKAASADPLYMEYMSINSPATAASFDPETLKRLRDHMRKNYPEVTLKW